MDLEIKFHLLILHGSPHFFIHSNQTFKIKGIKDGNRLIITNHTENIERLSESITTNYYNKVLFSYNNKSFVEKELMNNVFTWDE